MRRLSLGQLHIWCKRRLYHPMIATVSTEHHLFLPVGLLVLVAVLTAFQFSQLKTADAAAIFPPSPATAARGNKPARAAARRCRNATRAPASGSSTVRQSNPGCSRPSVVSSFSPVAWPVPTKNPASSSVARISVLREYVVSAHGRAGSSALEQVFEKRQRPHRRIFRRRKGVVKNRVRLLKFQI